MENIFDWPTDKKRKKAALGLASTPILEVLVELSNNACKGLVPYIDIEQTIDLCVPKYHKKMLLNIKKIAANYVSNKQPVYHLHLTGVHDAVLHVAGEGDDLPIPPDINGPAVTCDFELYSNLNKELRVWFNFASKLSRAYWTLMYFLQTNSSLGRLYTAQELRFIFHSLPPLVNQAIENQKREVEFRKAMVSQAWPGKKADKIHDAAVAKETLEELLSLSKKIRNLSKSWAAPVPNMMRDDIANLNETVPQALLLEAGQVEKPPGLYMGMSYTEFQPHFSVTSCDMIGLNPWSIRNLN